MIEDYDNEDYGYFKEWDIEQYKKEIERLKTELQDTKEHLGEYLHEQEEENKRLNKKIEQYENPEDMTLMFMWCDEKAKDEIKRLNNIINEFNKLIENEINESKLEEDYDRVDAMEYCLATLRELKGE